MSTSDEIRAREAPNQSFSLAAVLSVVGDKMLVTDVGKLYEILNYLTQDNLYTHQLPRAARECRPWIVRQHPQLVGYDDNTVNGTNWREWLATQEARFGKTLVLTPIPRDDHTVRDPVKELGDMVGPERVIVVDARDQS